MATIAPSSVSAEDAVSPLPDVIRLTVKAQYDDGDWTSFNVNKTAEEAASALRYRYPYLAAVTIDEFGGWVRWLRVIERPSFDSPVERYRICGLRAADIDSESSDDDVLPVRLVRLGCDDPGPEEPPIVPLDERQLSDNELIASVQDRAAPKPTE